MTKIAFLFLLLFQASPKPTPSPTPAMIYTGSNVWKFATPTTPTLVIHFEGNILLEINGEDGKKLMVGRDGKITGDLPHDKAAEDFWKAVAQAAPQCGGKQ